ncbi:GNAT family N-acetyltransferase [Photobacterium sp. CAIM 1938]|uniref:GNAT family N-acetyltransferase n=2 Tax=Photobacterium lucens TaxID=2562949 RepID=UPI00136B0CD1|nr:GNAT family N-acetyltransferase [Photobacterium lucens]MBP2700691.1 GNAT family N-acetyltransferase [Vibrio parahaemolyticus]MZG82357.1 GNAT family N-acetyltransferase [Photobacterium lucens]
MIEIKPFTNRDENAVKRIVVPKSQVRFASTAEDFIASATETMHLYVIYYHGESIGYFKLDIAYSEQMKFCPINTLGLRTVVISQPYQGKGIGTAVIKRILHYTAVHYARYDAIYLTVNCKNPAAKRCYEKSGFQLTGALFLEGDFGPQEVMLAYNHHDLKS